MTYFHNNILIKNEVEKYYIVKKCNKMAIKLTFLKKNAYKNHFSDNNNNNLFLMTKHENIYETCV